MSSADPCEYPYDEEFDGSCYRIDFWVSTKHYSAVESCGYAYNGKAHLLSVDSEEEYQYILVSFKQHMDTKYHSMHYNT